MTQLGRSLNGTAEVPRFCFSALSAGYIAPTGPHKFEYCEVQCRVYNCSVHLTVSSQETSRAVVIYHLLSLGPSFGRCISRMWICLQEEDAVELKVYPGSRGNKSSSSEEVCRGLLNRE